jgi:hypothetical protein
MLPVSVDPPDAEDGRRAILPAGGGVHRLAVGQRGGSVRKKTRYEVRLLSGGRMGKLLAREFLDFAQGDCDRSGTDEPACVLYPNRWDAIEMRQRVLAAHPDLGDDVTIFELHGGWEDWPEEPPEGGWVASADGETMVWRNDSPMTNDQGRALLEGMAVNLAILHVRTLGHAAVEETTAREAIDLVLSHWHRDSLGEIDLGERDRDRAAQAVVRDLERAARTVNSN